MSKKLLNKTSQVYLVYSLLLMVVLGPVFYFFTNKIYITDVEETLLMRRDEFLKYNAPTFKSTDIELWNALNRDVKIEYGWLVKNDSVFHAHYYDELSDENEPYLSLYSPITIGNKPHTYFTRIDLVETPDLVLNFVWLFMLVVALLLVGLYFITRQLSKRIWHPFYSILDQIEDFEIDKTTQLKLPATSVSEFNRLTNSLKKLIEKNTHIYVIQREFIENAAHELQTPLAIFKAKVDTLIQRSDVTEGQANELSSLNNNILRLERLNKNLLLLSKIENDWYHTKEELVINDILNDSLDFFTEQAASKQLSVKMKLTEKVTKNANSDLAEILLHNLFMNAVRHNVKNGKVIISTNTNVVVFSNTGQNQSLDTNQLFKRFSKNNPSKKGTGLGLSIVKKIADLNNWEVQYDFTDNLHSFSIRF